MNQEFEDEFNKALAHRHAGNVDEALAILSRLEMGAKGKPLFAVVNVIGRFLYYDKGDAVGALPYLQRAVRLAPRSESASIALFHVFAELGRMDEAFEEGLRFLADGPSEEYGRLTVELMEGYDKILRANDE